MKSPTNQKGVREFLGMVGYYRKFISRFTDAARPMTKLTRQDMKFEWSDDCQSGFECLKTCLTESSILKYPNPWRRYFVFTDAIDQTAAAVLTQEHNDDDNEIKCCLLLTFLHSFLTHNSSGALLLRKGINLLCH